MINTNEELIKRVKELGQSLIDNAENIVGDEKYLKGLTITCYPCFCDEPPYYNIDREVIPEGFIDRKR